MTEKQIQENFQAKIDKEFSRMEMKKLSERPVETIQQMAREDRVILNSKMLDYLRDFFNGIYDGTPIPKVFSKVLIEMQDEVSGKILRIYVTFPEDKPEWVYMDMFINWKFLGKVIFSNVLLDESNSIRYEDGSFFLTHYLTMVKTNGFSIQDVQTASNSVRDIFMYVYLYVQANKDNPEVFKEEVKKTIKEKTDSKKKKSKKRLNHNPDGRERIFVPTRRIYTVKKTENAEKKLAEYVYSRWKVRGYTYKRKDGKVVNVKEHYAFRHLPNKGLDKNGADFVLRPREDGNTVIEGKK